MSNMFRNIALATGLVAGTTLATNVAAVIQIDPNGTGSIGGSVIFTDPGSANPVGGTLGNLLADDVFFRADGPIGATNTSGWVRAQNAYVIPGVVGKAITYQFSIPVIATTIVDDGGVPPTPLSVRFRNDTTRVSEFKVYIQDLANIDGTTGAGFGDLNGSTANGAIEILSGTAEIRPTVADPIGSFSIADTDPGVSGVMDNDNRTDVASISASGSLTVHLNVLTQNGGELDAIVDANDYVINDMINAAPITLQDLRLSTLGPLAPFDDDVPASDTVVGATPNFGTGETAPGPTGPTGTVPFNNFLCGSTHDLLGTGLCDAQFQIAGNMLFGGTPVPEPVTLGMVGLGLIGVGVTARRRRKTA